MRLGLVADLHGRFDPLLPKVLAGVARILVAGDLVDEALLGRWPRIAPIEAVRGNNDTSPGFLRLPEFLLVEAAPFRLLIAHDRRDPRLARELARHEPDVLVVGHSHKPLVERDGSASRGEPGKLRSQALLAAADRGHPHPRDRAAAEGRAVGPGVRSSRFPSDQSDASSRCCGAVLPVVPLCLCASVAIVRQRR